MYLYVSVDSLIRSFENARRYAEAHNRGNEASMFVKIVRDLDTIKNIPPEAFAGFWSDSQMAPPDAKAVAPQEPEGAEQSRVNTTESLRNAQGPVQWPGDKPISPPEKGDTTPPPKPFITPDLPAGTPGPTDRQGLLAAREQVRQRKLDEDRANSVRNMPEVSEDDAD